MVCVISLGKYHLRYAPVFWFSNYENVSFFSLIHGFYIEHIEFSSIHFFSFNHSGIYHGGSVCVNHVDISDNIIPRLKLVTEKISLPKI